MSASNPAVTRLLATPPAMLEEVEQDPKALHGWMRKLLLVNVNAQHQALNTVNAPLGARQAFMEFLAKNGDVAPKQAAGAPGVGFSINFDFSGSAAPKTISGTVTTQGQAPLHVPNTAEDVVIENAITELKGIVEGTQPSEHVQTPASAP